MPSSAHIPALALFGLSFCTPAWTDNGIRTDRPDFVESSSVVGKGRVQIETGYGLERNTANGLKTTLSTTPTLLRFGMGETWELRLETDGRSRLKTIDHGTGARERDSGTQDAAIGMKWHMQDSGDDWKPAVAWLVHADLATGSRAFRGDGTRPSLRMVAEWDLANDWSVGIMPGVLWDKNANGKRYAAGIAAITLGKGWTDRLGTFLELAGQHITSVKNGGSQVTWDTGVTYLVMDDVQVDVSFSWGANRHTPDFAWGAGLSMRF